MFDIVQMIWNIAGAGIAEVSGGPTPERLQEVSVDIMERTGFQWPEVMACVSAGVSNSHRHGEN
jgi:hypothetical protein